ncbi:MAG TPA: hypothetical protein VKM94_21495 [Blastocatellia bacterium]|nr:hypothetical protein [Blastocatellia bacterium]
MNIGGYGVREHMRLLAPMFGLIAAVWVLRWVLEALGAPHMLVKVVSVSGATTLAILISVGLLHFRCVGGYSSVALASFLLVVWEQLLIVAAILFSVATGILNVFSEPEYSFKGDDPHHIKHIVGHLTFGVGAGVLLGSATGCLLLWLLRKLVPSRTSCQVESR